jgi:hypothetical protein
MDALHSEGQGLFRIFKAKSATKRSVLRKQRVQADRSRGLMPQLSWSLAAKSLIMVAIGCVIWGLGIRMFDATHRLVSYVNSVIVLTPREWTIEVTDLNGQKLSDDLRQQIYRTAQKTLKSGSPQDLHALARAIESLGMLDAVRVIRPVSDTILVQSNLRKPALLVETGSKIRFLTTDGTVFADASDPALTAGSFVPTVLVSGVFASRTSLALDASMRLPLLDDERRHLLDAIEVWQKTVELGIELQIINYQRFRGFSISLTDGSEIILGLHPFDYKLKKLRSILDGLKRDGIAAARIELDYEGKAFIKEKRL